MPRLLLSTSIKPFGQKYGDSFSCTANGFTPLLWAQGVFYFESESPHAAIDLIAQNLHVPTTVLHYPSLEDFIHEIKQGYDFVGLTVSYCTFEKIKTQISAVRKYVPKAKIILGGPGMMLPDPVLNGLADHVCRGEGVRFMRELFGEPVDAPLSSAETVCRVYPFSRFVKSDIEVLPVAAGCNRGCDFCATAKFFGYKKEYYVTSGRKLFEVIKRRVGSAASKLFIIYDEDFLSDRARMTEYLKCMRQEALLCDLIVFASVASIVQYTPEELVEMGICVLWIGIESQFAGYAKNAHVNIPQLCASLREHGISLVISSMVGHESQDKARIEEDFSYCMSLEPFISQILIPSPFFETPLWQRLAEEKRLPHDIYEQLNWIDGFSLMHEHPCFHKGEVERIQQDLYRREYQLKGPSALRMIYVRFIFFQKYKNSAKAHLRARAEYNRSVVEQWLPIFFVAMHCMASRVARARLKMQYKEIASVLPPRKKKFLLRVLFLLPVYSFVFMRFKLGLRAQPAFRRTLYRHSAKKDQMKTEKAIAIASGQEAI